MFFKLFYSESQSLRVSEAGINILFRTSCPNREIGNEGVIWTEMNKVNEAIRILHN